MPWLEDLSYNGDLPFNDVTVRNQKVRWASCSGKKNISINQKLLFLPEQLVTYIFVHELCHTIQLNHSKKFWSLVERVLPDYCEFDKQIRKDAWQKYVPLWSETTT